MTDVVLRAPRLSIVVPTMGKEKNLRRVLGSLVNGAPPKLLANSELCVYINADPESPIDEAKVIAYVEELAPHFARVSSKRSDRFHLTAEESAHAASAYAAGQYLWILGDARSLLPDGLSAVARFVEDAPGCCAYFNSVWYDSDGETAGHSSTHLLGSVVQSTFKQFVMHYGINFMATNMGAWVLERQYMDRDIWQEVMTTCGPHFSHVTTMLATLGSQPIVCHAVWLHLIEAKAYHGGSDAEWVRYSKLSKTHRFYAWSLGLVRQFNYLIKKGKYTYADVRRSMCSEGILLRRQLEEIYMHVLYQIRYGWGYEHERFTEEEFEEIRVFLSHSAPERVITNAHIVELYHNSVAFTDKQFFALFSRIQTALNNDHRELKYASLVIGQIGDCYIRLHPRGYLVAPVIDNARFLLWYKFLDAPLTQKKWRLLESEAELATLQSSNMPRYFGDIVPIGVWKAGSSKPSVFRARASTLVRKMYRRKLTVRLVAMMPSKLKTALRNRLL
jgi:hypothetical protein